VKAFFMNTAVVPTVWWEWKNASSAGIEEAHEVDGIRLLEKRVEWSDPRHGEATIHDLWCVDRDTDLDAFRADLVAGVSAAARLVTALLEPGRYLDELRALPVKQVAHRQALVVLLADEGESPELEDAFVRLRDAFADRPRAAGHIDRLVAWGQARAASRSA
jgi:hypothetical protein